MGKFQLSYKDGIIVFTFGKKLDENDFREFLTVLEKLLKRGKPFVFIVDASATGTPPLKASAMLVAWMKKHKPNIPGVLVGSGVILTNKTIIEILNWAFKKQPPTSPNIITNDPKKAENFVKPLLLKAKEKKI